MTTRRGLRIFRFAVAALTLGTGQPNLLLAVAALLELAALLALRGHLVVGRRVVDVLDAGNAPPEVIEHLVEDRDILGLREENRAHAEVDVAAIREVYELHHPQRVDDLRRGRQELARPQLASKRDDVALKIGVL